IFAFRSKKDRAVDVIPVATNLTDSPVAKVNPTVGRRSLDDLRALSSNASNTAEGATMSYEIREMIADRLATNETFRQWATAVVTTSVCKLVRNPRLTVYGSTGICPSNMAVQVDVRPVGGLRATAVYDPNTNSEGPLKFIVEGGANPSVTMVQN